MTVDNLPYDALYLSACPNAIGGVVIISANTITHVDQASKITALAVNGWAKRVTDLVLSSEEPTSDTHLEGSHCTFLSDTKLLLVLVDGKMHEVDFEHEGRLVRRLLLRSPLGMGPPPTSVLAQNGIVFVGSTSHHSVLLEVPSFDRIYSTHQKSSDANGTQMEFGMYIVNVSENFYMMALNRTIW